MQVDIKKVVDLKKAIGEEEKEIKVEVGYKVTCTFANKDTYCFIDRCTESQIPTKLHKYLKVTDTITVKQALYLGTSVDTIQSGGAGLSMILYGLSLDLTIVQKQKVFLALCGLIYSDLQLLYPCKQGTNDSALPLRIGAHFSEYLDMYFVLDSKKGKVILSSDSYGKNLTLTLRGIFTSVTPYRKMLETMAYAYGRVPVFLGKEGTRTKEYDGGYSVTVTSEKRQ